MDQWNTLSPQFQKRSDTTPLGTDNILIAWPALFEGIESVQPSGGGLKAFEFGCGTGSLCTELHRRGYQVVGSDTSSDMIQIARKDADPIISFHHASHECAATLPEAPFSLITSVMVLPFIENIEETFDNLDKALCKNGVIAIATFNPEYIDANTGDGKPYFTTPEPTQGTQTFLVIKGCTFPLYVRSEQELDTLFKKRSYAPILIKRPAFTRDFLEKYPTQNDTRFSEYIVMVYQKG